ncbi:MAG: hypothetical protein ACKVKM_14225, partial [Verrucomicrobiia bacterium]
FEHCKKYELEHLLILPFKVDFCGVEFLVDGLALSLRSSNCTGGEHFKATNTESGVRFGP